MTQALLTLALACTAAAFTAPLSIKQCDKQGCKPVQKRIALDAGSNATSSTGKKLIAISGGSDLTLTYGDAMSGGPRVYLIEEEGVNRHHIRLAHTCRSPLTRCLGWRRNWPTVTVWYSIPTTLLP